MSVLYIKDNNYYQEQNGEVVKIENPKISRKDVITSSIELKNIITYTFKLPKSLSPEQLNSKAEIQFYENAGLDLNKNFKTFYIKTELPQEESYLIEAIAIDEEKLQHIFKPIVEKTKYIDFISFTPFVFEEFWTIFDKPKKIDAFVYLDEKQSFVSLYKNGQYLYAKTLPNLQELLKNIDQTYEEFIQTISQKGLSREDYKQEDMLTMQQIESFISDYFASINNRLSYGKNIFYLDEIQNIYFYAPFTIKGIQNIKSFWDASGVNFEILPIEEINLLDKLATKYNSKNYKNGNNFSIFHRPPPFFKTRTFLFMLSVLVSFGLFLGDSGYRFYQNTQLKNQLQKLNKIYAQKNQTLSQMQKIDKIISAKLKLYNKQTNQINQQISNYKKILSNALNLLNLPKTNTDFIQISKLLQKNKLKVFSISKTGDVFKIDVYTTQKNRKFIAIFMDDLSNIGYKNIQTNKITNTKNNYYISLIRFEK
jgi:hypothetical protein